MNRDGCRKLLFPGVALASGLVVVAMDCAGLIGADLFWGLAELCCGIVAGLGFAALWMRPRFSFWEKVFAGLLTAVCIFTVWLWIPFGIGLWVRDPEQTVADRRWLGRAGFVIALMLAGTGGICMVYYGLFPPGVPFPWWQIPAGILAALGAAALGARYGLRVSGREALGVTCRLACGGAVLLLAAMLSKLQVWPAEHWSVYAVAAAMLVTAGYGAYRLKIPVGVRKTVRGTLAAVMILCAACMLQDRYLDVKYLHSRTVQQKWVRRRITVLSMPQVEACRAYRARTGVWPDDPGQLAPLIPKKTKQYQIRVIGCHTEPNGDFLLVMRRLATRPVYARRFHADGRESWEILDGHHPLSPPGAKRWKHPFPYTD